MLCDAIAVDCLADGLQPEVIPGITGRPISPPNAGRSPKRATVSHGDSGTAGTGRVMSGYPDAVVPGANVASANATLLIMLTFDLAPCGLRGARDRPPQKGSESQGHDIAMSWRICFVLQQYPRFMAQELGVDWPGKLAETSGAAARFDLGIVAWALRVTRG